MREKPNMVTSKPSLAVAPVARHRILIGCSVVATLTILYAWGWGSGVASAILALNNAGPTAPGMITVRGQGLRLIDNLALTAAAGCVFVMLRKFACGSMFVRRGHHDRTARSIVWRTWWQTAFIYAYCMLAGFIAIDLVSMVLHTAFHDYPFGTRFENTLTALLYIINMFFAGPTEELVLLGIVVIGLRMVNLPWWLIICTAVMLRVPFHLYYGWAAFAIAVWPVLAVLLYRRTGMITPFIVTHGMYDVSTAMTNLDHFAGSAWPSFVGYAIMAMPVVWAAVAMLTHLHGKSVK